MSRAASSPSVPRWCLRRCPRLRRLATRSWPPGPSLPADVRRPSLSRSHDRGTQMTPDEIVTLATDRGVQLVRFLYCDNGGVIRGKSTHVGQLARRMQSGIGLVKGMQSFTSLDSLAPDATYGPVGEIRLVPDPDTFVILPYAPRSGPMVVNMVELDHSPWALDPRAFLQRMVARAASLDLSFDAAFENEFFLAIRADGGYVPV